MSSRPSAIWPGLTVMVVVAWGTRCDACTPAPGYKQPTNFDLVGIADAIVVAHATDQRISRDKVYAAEGVSAVHFHVDHVLKGAAPREFDADMTAFADRTPSKAVPPSDPNELTLPNPEAWEGGCIRRLFSKAKSYVIFLSRGDDGIWRELTLPFARVNEDYFGERSLWIRTIRDYLAVQALPGGWPQHRALERLLRARQAEATPEAKVEAKDVRRALRALSARGWVRWRRPH